MPLMIPQRSGLAGINDTLTAMTSLVNKRYLHELIRAQAVEATRHCERGDIRCQTASLLAWVKRKMHYVKDPVNVEALHDPLTVAQAIYRGQKPFGDCDDFSIYLAALMKSIGIPATFRAVGFRGGPISHVYVVGPKGMKLDGTRNDWNPSLGELLPETSVLNWRV